MSDFFSFMPVSKKHLGTVEFGASIFHPIVMAMVWINVAARYWKEAMRAKAKAAVWHPRDIPRLVRVV